MTKLEVLVQFSVMSCEHYQDKCDNNPQQGEKKFGYDWRYIDETEKKKIYIYN